MYVVGLTGGIGSGKSTVAGLLARRGAVVVDADAISREVVEPGTEGFREVVDAFGDDVVGADGLLDRAKLAAVVFADPDRRRVLESIVWPKVGQRVTETLDRHRDTDDVVVLDVPLLFESPEGSAKAAQSVIVVAASEGVALDRLAKRGLARSDAEARMAVQAPLSDKIARADHVIWNDGTLDELEEKVDELWQELVRAKASA